MSIASAGRLAVVIVALVSTLLLAQGMAMAGTVTFRDLTDTITLSDDTGRTSGFTCFGEEACFVDLTAPFMTFPTSDVFRSFWAEPGTTELSDFISAFAPLSPPSYRIFISSDTEGGGGLGACPETGCTGVENGLVQTAFTLPWTNGFEGTVVATDTIAFQSDVETAPEPASAFLLLAGVGVAAMATRRGHRKVKG